MPQDMCRHLLPWGSCAATQRRWGSDSAVVGAVEVALSHVCGPACAPHLSSVFPKSKYRLAAWLVIARSQYQGLHSQLWGASRFSEWERALELFWVSVFLGWPDGK